MYTADKCKDHSLMCRNTILTLGHIAVALRQEEKVIFLCEMCWLYPSKQVYDIILLVIV